MHEEFDPIADADLCDEHEWAGHGDCPHCAAENAEPGIDPLDPDENEDER